MLAVAVLANPGPGSTACKASFPGISEPLKTFAETGEATQDLKCFMSCVMQDKGKMMSNGTITMMEPSADAPRMPESLSKAIAPCFAMTPTSDLCETAYLHNKCLWDNDPDKKFIRLFQ
ncbi:uncharacterized protein LOC117646144 isoform X2 [Thrips palmi]|uniref:Uncharacterized protein LOC117646144 isoform X2 n=1 Tax=Thrips palmi TaxID=161013 RepID=A0A6P8ZNQ6_THRPL|nr:uncharacterized protein LOC117646144 isoform X2 [Thrips palmi]